MLMSGSRPLADAVTKSTGTGRLLVGSADLSAAMRVPTASVSAGLSGPRLEAPEAIPLYGCGAVADGRLQKYFGSLKLWPMIRELYGVGRGRIVESDAQVMRLVRRWVICDWLRVAAIGVAFLSSVRAISVPFPGAQGSRSS